MFENVKTEKVVEDDHPSKSQQSEERVLSVLLGGARFLFFSFIVRSAAAS
jgi:hypothetical protein